jgi:hypothetical protein
MISLYALEIIFSIAAGIQESGLKLKLHVVDVVKKNWPKALSFTICS